jgi:hypothetical protein
MGLVERVHCKTHPEYAREYYRRNKEKMLKYGRKYRQRKRVEMT